MGLLSLVNVSRETWLENVIYKCGSAWVNQVSFSLGFYFDMASIVISIYMGRVVLILFWRVCFSVENI